MPRGFVIKRNAGYEAIDLFPKFTNLKKVDRQLQTIQISKQYRVWKDKNSSPLEY